MKKLLFILISFIFSTSFWTNSVGTSLENFTIASSECINDEINFVLNIQFDETPALEHFTISANGNILDTISNLESEVSLIFSSNFDPVEISLCPIEDSSSCVTKRVKNPCSCTLGALDILITECDHEGNFDLVIDFEYSGVSDSFRIGGNGHNYGTYSYNELPIILQNLQGDGTTPYEIIVNDQEDFFCIQSASIGIIECDISTDCSITDLVVEHFCDEEGKSWFDIDFNHNNELAKRFILKGDGVKNTNFSYGDLPVRVENSAAGCQDEKNIEVIDIENFLCSDSYLIDTSTCCRPPCMITEVIVSDVLCESESSMKFTLDFIPLNPLADRFSLHCNDELVGNFSYSCLPIKVTGAKYLVQNFQYFEICDTEDPSCCTYQGFSAPHCETDMDCLIRNVTYEIDSCDMNENTSLTIDFSYQYVSDSFYIRGNGNEYGIFPYDDLPVTLNNLQGDCQSIDELIILDQTNPNCRISVNLDGPLCCDASCRFDNFTTSNLECESDSTFLVTIDFDPKNLPNDFYYYFTQGQQFVGNKESLPLRRSFDINSSNEYSFMVCGDLENICCDTFRFEGPECTQTEICSIDSMTVTTSECSEDGYFFVVIDFVYSDGLDSFSLKGNGTNYGHFSYQDLPIFVDSLVGYCDVNYEFVAVDLEDEECSDIYEFTEPMCCLADSCKIEFMATDQIVCESTNSISFRLNFLAMHPTNEHFDLYCNDTLRGFFRYEDLPIRVENCSYGITQEVEIRVCDNDNPECCSSLILRDLGCDITSNDNEIKDLFHLRYDSFNDEISITLNQEDTEAKMELYNINGSKLISTHLTNRVSKISLSETNLFSGIYIVVVQNERSLSSFKIFVP